MQRRFSATSHSLTKQHHQYKTEDTRLISGAAMTWLTLYQKWSIANTNTYTNPIPSQYQFPTRCSHDVLVHTISEMEHYITRIGTNVDFCQVWCCWSCLWWWCLETFNNMSTAAFELFESILVQAHQDILSCSRNGLKPAEVLITNIKTWIFIKNSLQWFWNAKVEAILTVQTDELWTATETVNIFETKKDL